MKYLKKVIGFFLSLKTTIWLVGMLLLCFFMGAFVMPAREEFRLIHAQPLFTWLRNQPVSITWWLWISIILVSVIVVNTLFCSVESIITKGKSSRWLLRIAPQIVHTGFVFIIFAHFLSAGGSESRMVAAEEGSELMLEEGHSMKIQKIRVRSSLRHINSWEVAVAYYGDGNLITEDIIRPNHPFVKSGTNITVKDIRVFPSPAVLLQINREPGALWALSGGIMFMVGITILIVLKINRERELFYQ